MRPAGATTPPVAALQGGTSTNVARTKHIITLFVAGCRARAFHVVAELLLHARHAQLRCSKCDRACSDIQLQGTDIFGGLGPAWRC